MAMHLFADVKVPPAAASSTCVTPAKALLHPLSLGAAWEQREDHNSVRPSFSVCSSSSSSSMHTAQGTALELPSSPVPFGSDSGCGSSSPMATVGRLRYELREQRQHEAASVAELQEQLAKSCHELSETRRELEDMASSYADAHISHVDLLSQVRGDSVCECV